MGVECSIERYLNQNCAAQDFQKWVKSNHQTLRDLVETYENPTAPSGQDEEGFHYRFQGKMIVRSKDSGTFSRSRQDSVELTFDKLEKIALYDDSLTDLLINFIERGISVLNYNLFAFFISQDQLDDKAYLRLAKLLMVYNKQKSNVVQVGYLYKRPVKTVLQNKHSQKFLIQVCNYLFADTPGPCSRCREKLMLLFFGETEFKDLSTIGIQAETNCHGRVVFCQEKFLLSINPST